MNSGSLAPAALSGASIVIQVCLLTVAYVALAILGRSVGGRYVTYGSHSSLVLWLLLTIIVIVMGEDFYAQWGPILGEVQLPSIPRGLAFAAVFSLDIIFVTVLIYRTGGAKNSPFTSILLLLPTLAIFLREPSWRFLVYSGLVGLVYVSMLRVESIYSRTATRDKSFEIDYRGEEKTHDWATRWTNIACLALATLIGYITQPK